MSSKRVYEIEGIDLASFLVTAGHEATIYRNLEGKRAVFSFPKTTSSTRPLLPMSAARLYQLKVAEYSELAF